MWKWEINDGFIPVSCSWMPEAKWKRWFKFGFLPSDKNFPRGRKNHQVDTEGIGYEQRNTQLTKVRIRRIVLLPVIQKKFLFLKIFPDVITLETDDNAKELSTVNVMESIEDYGSIIDDDDSWEDAIAEGDASDSVNVMDCIEDYASTFEDDSNNKEDLSEDDACGIDDKGSKWFD